VLTTRIITRRVVRAALAHPERIQERIERELDRKLTLDAQQQAEVHRVLQQSREQLQELRRETQPRLRTILGGARREIAVLLTPEQRKRFDEFLAEYPLSQVPAATEQKSAPAPAPSEAK